MKRKMIAFLASMMLLATGFTGCGKNNELTEEEKAAQAEAVKAAELQQNDYRGGIMRTYAFQENVLNLMETMKSNNITIRQDSPNSFWTEEGYEDFVVNFLNKDIMLDTQWFNEEETTWDMILTQIVSVDNSFTSMTDGAYHSKFPKMIVERNEKDDYEITGVTGDMNHKEYNGDMSYRILYDCDKDWCKAYSTLEWNDDILPVNPEIFEYARIDDNTFAIQTNTERLYIVLNPSEADIDIRDRTIKEFYYSRLTSEGMRTTYTPYIPLDEYDPLTGRPLNENMTQNKLMEKYALTNNQGDLILQYGTKESLFLTDNIKETVNIDWVFEDKSLQQAIIYKDGALVVTTYNKLSHRYERFVYSMVNVKEADVKKLEDMIDMKELVGIQEIERVTVIEPETTEPESNTESEVIETSAEAPENTEEVQEETPSPDEEELEMLNSNDEITIDEEGNIVEGE